LNVSTTESTLSARPSALYLPASSERASTISECVLHFVRTLVCSVFLGHGALSGKSLLETFGFRMAFVSNT
jgi:hypothetical protein